MSKLTARGRKHISAKNFALPGRRFPIHDSKHAHAALSGASRALHRHTITRAQYNTILRKVHRRYPSIEIETHASTRRRH